MFAVTAVARKHAPSTVDYDRRFFRHSMDNEARKYGGHSSTLVYTEGSFQNGVLTSFENQDLEPTNGPEETLQPVRSLPRTNSTKTGCTHRGDTALQEPLRMFPTVADSDRLKPASNPHSVPSHLRPAA